MSAIAVPGHVRHSVPDWHDTFLADVLPAVQTLARVRFRRLQASERVEAIAEATATALIAFIRLTKRGRNPVEFASKLARFAVLRICAGRLSACPDNSRDVLSRYARQSRGFVVESIDAASIQPDGEWREIVVEDRRTCPAQIAAIRLDFAAWLGRMPRRRRRIAECLAQGHQTSDVARRFRLSPARISQIRDEFRQSWLAFQSD